MTTFGSSSLKYVSAVLGCHSFSETVYFGSLSLFRLISSFHNSLQNLFIVILVCRPKRKIRGKRTEQTNNSNIYFNQYCLTILLFISFFVKFILYVFQFILYYRRLKYKNH